MRLQKYQTKPNKESKKMGQAKNGYAFKVVLVAVFAVAFIFAFVLGNVSQTNITAQAESTISYIDENGTTRTAGASQITKNWNSTDIKTGWYYVSGEVKMNIDYHLNIVGDVKIILVNGAVMHQYNPVHISAGSTLTIYGQTTGDNMGKMRVTDPYNTTVDGEGTLVVRSGWLDVARTASGSPAITCATQIYGGKTTVYGLTSTAIAGSVTLGSNMIVKAGDSSGSVSLVENYETNHGHRYAVISKKVNVSGLSFSKSSAQVNAGGDIIRYLPTVAPSSASYNELRYITWSSSNNSVATVNANGYVQPIAAGTTTITATATNGTATTSDDKKASYTVTVVNPTPVSYLDYNEETGTFFTGSCPAYQVLTNQWTWGTEGYTRWYVVESNQSLSKPMYSGSNLEPLINVIGDVRLIIKDGVRLAIDTHGIKIKSGASLTIYAQSTGSQMGELYSNGTTGEGAYPAWNPGNPGIDADSATLTINGCKVTGQAGRNDIGISCQYNGRLVVNAGEVYGYSRMGNIHAGLGDPEGIGGINSTIVVNGGKVFAEIPYDNWGYALGCAPRWGWSSITINGGEVTSTAYSIHASAFGGGLKLGEKVYMKTGDNANSLGIVNSYNGAKYAYVTGNPILVDSVTLNKTSLTMVAGDKTEQLTAVMNPSNNFFNYPKFLIWSSSDESIATVDQNGLVYPVAPGNVTIAATANNGTPDDPSDDVVSVCNVTVNAPEPISYRDFTKNGDYIDDKYCTDYTNVIEGRTEWGKIGRTTWYVVKSDLTYGKIIVHGDVRFIVMDGVTFTVNGVSIRAGGKLTIYSQSDIEATMGKLINNNAFEGNVVFNGGNVKVSGTSCAVTGVATFNDGYIEMNTSVVSYVEAKISSHLAAHTGDDILLNLEANFNKPNVKVSPRILATSITLDKTSLDMIAGADPYTIKVIFTPSTATFNDSRFVDFTSSNEAVAVVDAYGVVHPIAPGTTVITATANNYTDDTSDDVTATITVKVTAPTPVTYNEGANTCDAYETVTGDKTVFGSKGFTRWYVVSGNVTVNERINVIDNVNLILLDGATLTVNGGLSVTNGNTLNVYSQSCDAETMGKLNATGVDDAGIGNGGNINFYGGTIWASENGAIVGSIRLASGLVYMVGDDKDSVALTSVNGNYKYAPCAYVGKPIALTKITLATPDELKVRGSYATLNPVFTPSNATYRGLSYLKWTSSDTSVATVDGNGRVYPVAPGKVTITVVATKNTEDESDDLTATCEITVGIVEVSEITLDKDSAELRVNVDTLKLKSTITPADASYLNVVWSSSDDGIATVDQTGKVTPVKAGNVTITATAVGGKSATCQIAVVFSHTEVTLDKSEITLSANGANGNLYHTLTNQYASDRSVVWTSSDPSVATVDQNGVVKPIWQGTATITVTAINGTPDDDSDDEIAQCTVTVNAVSVTQVVMSKTSITLFEKDIARVFTASVLPENASYKNIIWSTSDPSVASVDENGRIAPLMVGTATITATATNNPGDASDDVVSTCLVTVVARDPLYYYAYDPTAKTFIEGMCYTYALVSDFAQQWSESDETGNWYVANSNITLNDRVVVSGNVNLIILDGVTVNALKGINVPSGSSLTIYTQSFDENTMGVLKSTGADRTAGIGSNDSQAAGDITIHGGVINARGGNYAAGIGGGQAGAGGTTIIYGGFVTAVGGGREQYTAGFPAGIGGGANAGESYGSAGGNIVINGGYVIANSNSDQGRAIGGGGQFYYDSAANYTVTLGNCMIVKERTPNRGDWRQSANVTIVSNHSYGDWDLVPPSNTKDGYAKRTCSVCGEIETVYYHKFACVEHQLTKIEEKDATCAENGNAYEYWHCDVCGYNFADDKGQRFLVEIEIFPALPHTVTANSEWVVVKEATCAEEGRMAILCTVCGGEVETKAIPAIGHDWTPWHPSDEEGKETRTCLTCGNVQTRDEVNSEVHTNSNKYQGELATVTFNGIDFSSNDIGIFNNASFTVNAKIKIIDHIVLHVASINNYSDRVRASSGSPSLSDDGYVVTINNVNAASVTISLSQYFIHFDQFEVFYNGLQERYKVVEGVDATCTEAGNSKYWYDTYTCKYYSDENGENEIELADTVIPALGHDVVRHDGKSATCTEIGWVAYDTCSRCDYTTYSEIAALGHVAGTWTVKTQPGCTEKGEETSACSVCGEVMTREIDALGHSWGEWVEDQPEVGKETHTCSVCGASEAREMRNYAEMALKSDIPQYVGDYAVVDTPDGGWENEGSRVSDGGITITGKDGRFIKKVVYHVSDLEFWADDAYADKGELTLSDGNWTITVDNIYSNSVRLDCPGPLMIGTVDIYFVEAGYVQKVDAVSATCTKDGNIEYWHDLYNDLYYSDEKCTISIGKAEVVIPALGHTESEWMVTLEPTCTEVGSRRKICTVCNEELKVEEMAALGHDMVYVEAEAATNCAGGHEAGEICSRCGYTTVVKSPADPDTFPHTWGRWMDSETESGKEYRVCRICGTTESRMISTVSVEINPDRYNNWNYRYVRDYAVVEFHGGDSPLIYAGWNADLKVSARDGRSVIKVILTLYEGNGNAVFTDKGVVTSNGNEIIVSSINANSFVLNSNNRIGVERITVYVSEQARGVKKFDYLAATCTEDGHIAYWYDVYNNMYFSDEACENEIALADTVIAKTGHDIHQYEAKAATCTEIGWRAYEACTRCDYTTRHEIAELGHLASKTIEIVAPTCTERGYTVFSCSRCGENYNARFISALGHISSDWSVTKEPTCQDKGSKHKVCTVCSEELEVEDLEKVDHVAGEWTISVAPTCTSKGRRNKYCTVCDTRLESEEIAAHGHIYVNWEVTLEPTCTEKGSKHRVCYVCENEEVEEIAALGHSWNAWTKQSGKETHTCSVCGTSETRNSLKGNETIAINNAVPNYSGAFANIYCGEPGFDEDGAYPSGGIIVTTKDRAIIVKAVFHVGWGDYYANTAYANKGQVTADYDDNDEMAIFVDNVYSDSVELWQDKRNSPAIIKSVTLYYLTSRKLDKVEAVAPTCTSDGNIGYYYDWYNDMYYQFEDCEDVIQRKDTVIPAYGHKLKEVVEQPTCTRSGYKRLICSICEVEFKVEEMSALGHEMVESGPRAATCSAVGLETACEVCSRCGYSTETTIATLPHTPAEQWVVTLAPTCLEKGSKHLICTVCNAELEVEEIAALGHNPGEWEFIREPDCTTKGIRHSLCTLCGVELKIEKVPAIGHRWGKWIMSTTDEGKESHTCSVCGEVVTRNVPPRMETPAMNETGIDVSNSITLNGKDGSYIERVILTMSWYPEYSSDLRAEKGDITISDNGNKIDIKNIYSKSVKLWTEDHDLWIKSITYYYVSSDSDIVKVEAVAPTCTVDGNIEYWYDYYNDLAFSEEECENVIFKENLVVPATGHDFGEWEITTEPTCTEKGRQRRVCANCNKEEYLDVPALGHKMVYTQAREATCNQLGLTTDGEICSRCGYTTIETIPFADHTWSRWIDSETEEGKEVHTCRICGTSESRDIVSGSDTIETNTSQNNYSGQYTDIYVPQAGDGDGARADRDDGGIYITAKDGRLIEKIVCSVGFGEDNSNGAYVNKGNVIVTDEGYTITVENIYSNYVAFRAQEYLQISTITVYFVQFGTLVKTEALAPTCTEDGNVEYWFDAYSNMYFLDESCQNQITDLSVTVLPALGHSAASEWVVTKESTCTEYGRLSLLCSACGIELEGEDIALLPHTAADEWTVTKAPTCTEAGRNALLCTVCGTELDGKDIDALGHDLIHHDYQAPTCTEFGWNEYDTCSRCDYTTYQRIAKIAHTPATEWTVTKEPTCANKGVKAILCTECGTVLQTKNTSPTGHDIVFVEAKAPTCTEAGWEAYEHCSHEGCTYSTKVEIPALGHAKGEFIEKVDPTCTEEGYSVYHCSRCEETMKADFVPALGHTLGGAWIVVTEPTCTEEGVQHRLCTVCGEESEIGTIPALGHASGDWEIVLPATCTEKGTKHKVCTICGVETETAEIEAKGHEWGEWEITLEATCLENGSKVKHCTVCGEETEAEEIPALGHDFGEWEITLEPTCTEKGSRRKVCSRCEEEVVEELDAKGHTFGDWEITKETTCSEAGTRHRVCQCGEEEIEEIEKLPHTRSDWEIQKEPTCTEKGAEHIYCTVCNEDLEVKDIAMVAHTEADEWVTTLEPTCTEKGSQHKVCTVCGEELDVLDIAELGHEWGDWTTVKEATETEEGSEERVCSRCNEKESRYIPLLGHTHNIEFVEEKAPTCTEDGNIAYYRCTECSRLFVDEAGESPINADDVPVPALGHDYHEDVVAPTCTEKGSAHGYCTRCDYTIDEEIDALGHDILHQTARMATCTDIGWNAYDFCSRCDYTTYEEIEALGHEWGDWEMVVEPTCTEKGTKHKLCTVCGVATEEEEAEALGHTAGDWEVTIAPTCTENGSQHKLCVRCGEELEVEDIQAGHTASEWITTLEPTCTEKGSKHKVCIVCGEEVEVADIDALGHTASDWVTTKEPTCTEKGSKHKVCTVCGEEVEVADIDALGHTAGEWETTLEPTCTEKGSKHKVCLRCGEEVEVADIDALGHTAGVWSVKTEPTCTEKGSDHIVCTVCGEELEVKDVDALGHDYQAVVTDPTCTEKGYTTHTCSRCDDSYVDTYVDALGHTEGEWIVTKEPTCTEKGSKHKVCSVCGEEVEVADIDALGHTASDWVTTKEPTCTEKGSKHKVCSVCGEEVEVADIDALGHTAGDWVTTKEPTCTEKGSKHKVCSVCGEEVEVEEIDTIDHDYIAVVTDPTCTERGYTTHTCSLCGGSYVDSYVDALGHDFGEWIVTKEAEVGVKGEETRTCARCGEIETRPIAALPYVPTINDDGEKIYAETVTEEAKDVTELFAQAKEEKGSVEVKAEELTIVFDNNAVNAIGDSNVSLSAKISTENLIVPNAELVLEVTLIGATFENGEAKVSIPFEKVVPQGKVAKVYYIADDGTRTDMKATFADGKVTFVTNHFSTYAVIFEDIPVGGLSGGAIAGIVISFVIVLALIGLLVYDIINDKKKLNKKA